MDPACPPGRVEAGEEPAPLQQSDTGAVCGLHGVETECPAAFPTGHSPSLQGHYWQLLGCCAILGFYCEKRKLAQGPIFLLPAFSLSRPRVEVANSLLQGQVWPGLKTGVRGPLTAGARLAMCPRLLLPVPGSCWQGAGVSWEL